MNLTSQATKPRNSPFPVSWLECLLSAALLLFPTLPSFGRSDPPAPSVVPTPTPALVTPVPRDDAPKLTPAERELRSQQLRERKAGLKKEAKPALTPAEREKRRHELRQRLQHRLETLRKKQKEGTLSPEEQKQLTRYEELSKRFEGQKKEPLATPADAK